LNEFEFSIPKFPGLRREGLEFESLGHLGLRGLKFESSVFREGLEFEALVSEMPQVRGVVSKVLGPRRSWASAWAGAVARSDTHEVCVYEIRARTKLFWPLKSNPKPSIRARPR
jgi:hypothetical protein